MSTLRLGSAKLCVLLSVAVSSACSSGDKRRRAVLEDAGPGAAEASLPDRSVPEGAGGAPPDTVDAAPNVDADSGTDAGSVVDANDASVPGVYVDSTNGVDTNTGASAASAFKTFAKAVTVAKNGETIFVADGTYDATSEGSPTTVSIPGGVSVRATHDGLSVIAGLPMTANGASGTVYGLSFDQGASLSVLDTIDANPSLTFSNLHFTGGATYDSTLAIGGNTKVTLVSPQFSGHLRFGVVNLSGAASLVINGGSFDGGGFGSPGFGYSLITVSGTTALTLDGVTMKNSLFPGIGVAGSSATPVVVTLRNGTVLDTIGSPGNCASGGAVILSQNANLFVDNAKIVNAPSAGVCVRNGATSNVSVDIRNGSTFTNDGRGIGSEIGVGSVMKLTMDGATLSANAQGGIYWEGWGTLDIKNTSFQQNATGMYLATNTPVSVGVHGSAFSNNGNGVQMYLTAAGSTLDFGSALVPGGNTFATSTTTSMDVNVPVAQSVTASGNTWTPNVEGADAAGHYPTNSQATGPATTGANYRLTNASTIVF